MVQLRVAPYNITFLEKDDIFVFGSNEAGIHGAGAARKALDWGAKIGEGIGLFGKTYAVPSKDHELKVLPLDRIKEYADEFAELAGFNKHLRFLVTRIGCGLAGYTDAQIAPLFENSKELDNVWFPQSFQNILWGRVDVAFYEGKDYVCWGCGWPHITEEQEAVLTFNEGLCCKCRNIENVAHISHYNYLKPKVRT